MEPLWILRGKYEAPGWKNLEKDAKEGVTDVVMFDRLGWALVRAAEAPTAYEGMKATEPPDGLYLDPSGSPIYLFNREGLDSAEDLVRALGPDAEKLFEELGDAHAVLERMGKVY
ncbi:MAG: hypothetical protein GY906_16890 [bacterium]|nr:hypothetical protein [bacterium]